MSNPIANAQRIVLKLGTQIVINDDGSLAFDRLAAIIAQCAQRHQTGQEILLVSSGAVGLGRKALGLMGQKLSLSEKQACAAVGQGMLMDIYRECFQHYRKVPAQLLLTAYDFSDRQRYLNLRETLERLLAFKTIPIINENDSISTTELAEDNKTKSFGDNDTLSALVASKLGADLLIILTNVDGLYTENPQVNPAAERIATIEGFEQLSRIRLNGQSQHGRGGMASKVEAAKIAALSGVHTLICSGYRENAISRLFESSADEGTLIRAKSPLSERKRWLGFASGYEGIVIVNDGAKKALVQKQASLLPSGVVAVEGEYQPKQVVSIQDLQGLEIGRGLINFSAQDTLKIKGCHSQDIASILGATDSDVIIHRDNLVIYEALFE